MSKTVPPAILTAAVGMLAQYYPDLSADGLTEALKHRDANAATPTAKKPLTKRQAAAALQVSIASIDRYMRAGTLRAFKIGKRLVRIDPASVEALMQTQTAPAPEV